MSMITKLRPWIAPAFGIAGALVLNSCTYNPGYYGPADGYGSYGGYSSYGASSYSAYPGSNFSTSVFISTGSPRWGYDPYCRSYYDYTRHCYYDPWLRGYYPRGYRPPILVGVPHPHGWHSGRNTCPPPSNHRDYTLVNYKNRGDSYRQLGQTWSRDVRVAPASHHPQTIDGGNHRPSYQNAGNNSPYQGVIKRPARDYKFGTPDLSTRPGITNNDPAYQKRLRMQDYPSNRNPSYRGGSGHAPAFQPSVSEPKRESTRSHFQPRAESSFSKPDRGRPSTPSPQNSGNSNGWNQGNSEPKRDKGSR